MAEREELINILRGWHKAFVLLGKAYERNVQALAQAADMLEMDLHLIEGQQQPKEG